MLLCVTRDRQTPVYTQASLALSAEGGEGKSYPFAVVPLPTAHCPLPTAHCPLPTAGRRGGRAAGRQGGGAAGRRGGGTARSEAPLGEEKIPAAERHVVAAAHHLLLVRRPGEGSDLAVWVRGEGERWVRGRE